ncbi:T9SS type A sorting domain-containing protein [Fulvivirga lutea]|uniref:T9SS type A sorting domain-containing protein n=1 Tax=Fulvivirga lutea TaxID=2810512 RepID=A0A975A1S1_9BACT|nr:T9SS type A sorting domain-containing protein [Fulvivirga lutea]QSE98126.1 T9SS type A sorting domain-containing protein [Fulvivirga lutea]
MRRLFLTFIFALNLSIGQSQHSIARIWNDAVLEGIRNDFARPTVHARNLFHTSVAMYDAWNAFEGTGEFYLLGKSLNGYKCQYNGIVIPTEPTAKKAAQEEAISFAVYRIMQHRFANSPGSEEVMSLIDDLMDNLGYDRAFTSTNLEFNEPAALGNYIAQCIIEYGLMDGSNEANGYENLFYEPVNDPLAPAEPGNSTMSDPNRWQPLTLEVFIDQGGNVIPGATPAFLSPEWGQVFPFSLTEEDLTIYERDGGEYWVYHDPSDPPYLESDGGGLSDEYKWTFSLVSIWSSHLDPSDGVMWDISPGASGNVDMSTFPIQLEDYRDFYDTFGGGDPGTGRSINPKTGQPYPENIVPRGDYGRVLAEFWADGPDSETPPGHWFTILNEAVHDHPDFKRLYKGEGTELPDLEWDVKAYFMLGGAMHDCAISAWGIKGWYDYTRPISAIRYMAEKGQSSDENLPSYHPEGIPLEPGYIELVEAGDPLAGASNENVGKIKLYAWKGPDFIADPDVDIAGVDWILADNWWPYQRPSFITPPFAGYVSGHSTYSRAAAEVLTLLTGDEYFPGGVGEFEAPMNEFLVFEDGPSVDVTLQWATYRDASDQTSLSRIWGGIHPPADDIRGRIIGYEIAQEAFTLADNYFNKVVTSTEPQIAQESINVFPNPTNEVIKISGDFDSQNNLSVSIIDLKGAEILNKEIYTQGSQLEINVQDIKPGTYILQVTSTKRTYKQKLIIQ